ncbi:MAG: phosphoribosylformylglycinamidine cyclo-ligase [Deferribacteraceae bacterium]|nr:phosphoribosylformylglycinamidine cyclo-ligase [Deferribacteraceae bacterium]
MSDTNLSYSKSGVNIDEGNRFVSLIKNMVESTHNKAVLGGLGGFAGFYELAAFKNMAEPVLVASTDGVGTKLKVAIDSKTYDTVGIDLVAMSVNDLIVTGARPLFFLDYVATGKLSPEAMSMVVRGIVDGCKQAGCALLGGETAEMPGMYADGDFDLAGFAVGIVDKAKAIDGSRIKKGDIIAGLASSGFHSNGFSLLRKIFGEKSAYNRTILEPTKIYVPQVLAALDAGIDIKGMVHITGGGFYDNIPRVLPEGLGAEIDKNSFPNVPAVAALRDYIKSKSLDIGEHELYRVFNMGIGYIFVVDKAEYAALEALLARLGAPLYNIGVVTGSEGVKIKGIDSDVSA